MTNKIKLAKSNLNKFWPSKISKICPYEIQNLDKLNLRRLKKNFLARSKKNRHYGGKYKNKFRRTFCYFRIPGGQVQEIVPKRYLVWQKKESSLLDHLYPERSKRWRSIPKRKSSKEFTLKNFSFIDNPTKTLEALAEIVKSESYLLSASVHFDDELIKDIGPYVLWGMMKQHLAPFMIGGKMAPPVQKVFDAVGLAQYMGISLAAGQDNVDVWSFRLRERRKQGTSINQNSVISAPTFSKVSDDLVETIDDWLRALKKPVELSGEGKYRVNNIVTEILNNAERHSSQDRDGNWVVAGFMARRFGHIADVEIDTYACHIAFVSTGMTIAESIARAETNETLKRLSTYIQRHKNNFSEETLSTVFALQDGISRFTQSKSKGGVGFMDVIELVNDLGSTNHKCFSPSISIISGNTCILLKDNYNSMHKNEDGIRSQLFNPSNSLDFPPDNNYVFSTKQKIPGTVISLRFYLDSDYLSKTASDEND